MTKPANKDQGREGIGIDYRGDQVIDPTKNVEDLVKREILHVKELGDLREANQKEISQIREGHGKEMLNLHTMYGDKLKEAEAKRLDAINTVNVTAAQAKAESVLNAVNNLATRTAEDAENLRQLVTTTAAALAKTNQDTNEAFQRRISSLEDSRAQGLGKERVSDPAMTLLLEEVKTMKGTIYEWKGKEKVVDPQMFEFMKDMKDLIKLQSEGKGKEDLVSRYIPWIIAALAVLWEMFKPK